MKNEELVRAALATAMALRGYDRTTKLALCKEIIRQYRDEQKRHAEKEARLERAMQWPKTKS